MKNLLNVLSLFLILISLCGFYSGPNKNLGGDIDSKLEAICSNRKVMFSSNPYDYIDGNKNYKDIVNLGNNALKYMLTKFKSTKENGLKEYIMAIACSEILKENPSNKKWASGKEWYNNYIKSQASITNEVNTGSKKISLSKAEEIIGIKPLKEVTTDEFWTKLRIQAFEQINKNTIKNSYFIKDNKVLDFDHGYSNIDIKNMCISDLDKDGKPELLYTYNFGSGLCITVFCCYVDGKQISVKFGSIRFCSFKFIKKDMQNVEIGVWWPNIDTDDKNSIPIGKLYIKDNALNIKIYDNISKELKEYIMSKPSASNKN